MKRATASLSVVAAVSFVSPSTAQPPPIDRSPVATTAGVRLSSYSVRAKCGAPSHTVIVLDHDLRLPTRALLSLPLGDQEVELPSGKGTRTVQLVWKKLVCTGPATNLNEVLRAPLRFDGQVFQPTTVGASSSPVPPR